MLLMPFSFGLVTCLLKTTNYLKEIMNQHVMFHFSLVKNERVYQLIIQPGAPWQEIEEVMEEFGKEFLRLKKEAQEKEESDKNRKEKVCQSENKGFDLNHYDPLLWVLYL